MSNVNSKTKSVLRRTLWWGLAASLLLHAGLLAVIVFGTVRSWFDLQPIHVIQASSTYSSQAEKDAATSATVVIDEPDPMPADFQQQFEASLAATEQLTETERIEALDTATNRLDRISSEASIDDVAKRLQSWLGLTPRAANPAAESVTVAEDPTMPEPPDEAEAEGEFDFETAQLHDVRRIDSPDSRPQYVCVMLDAHGRTMEVPLSESEGEPIYALMEKIKASPLLEKIYRQIAMPMLDQMVKAERAATAAATKSRASEADSVRAVPTIEPPADDVPDEAGAPR